MEELKEGWRRVKLGEISTFLSGYAFKGSLFSEEGHKVIKIKNVNGKFVDINNTEKYPKELCEKLAKYKIKNNDILIAMTGAGSVGRVSKFKYKGNNSFYINQRVGKIIIDSEKANSEFIFQIISTQKYEKILFDMANGSGQPNLSPKLISEVEIELPPLETQEKIASILSALDDKIEINNEMNKTLEEMAQTLFKRWFIDFDFPNENGEPYRSSGGKMVDSELGEIPEGWEVATLETKKEFGELIMGLSPKSESYNDLQQGLPLLNGAADFTKLKLSPKKYTTSPTRIAKKGDYVFCIRATIGLLSITDKDYVIGRGVATIKDIKVEYREYIYMVLNNSFNKLKQNATGSVIQGLSKPDINNMKILFPIYSTMQRFNENMSKIFEKIENNKKEIQSLIEIRDTLLPKLMSGEVEV